MSWPQSYCRATINEARSYFQVLSLLHRSVTGEPNLDNDRQAAEDDEEQFFGIIRLA